MFARGRTRGSRLCLLLFSLGGFPAAVLGAPQADLWPYWDVSDETSQRRVDHDAWQGLLDRYLVAAEDGRTLFRYTAVTETDQRRLDAYLDELTSLDPRTLARAEQFAYWVNLYNALTVSVVLEHPGRTSIRRMGGGLFRSGPWRDKRLEIAGQRLSLDDIEHRILRPIWRDHRIHFAVNCASIGCPDLLPQAFVGDNLEARLQDAERRFLSHPRAVAFEDGRLRLSSLFDWYGVDFADSRSGLLAYLARHRPDLAERLDGYSGRIDHHYDWALNDAP
jgi:hypothetical protein